MRLVIEFHSNEEGLPVELGTVGGATWLLVGGHGPPKFFKFPLGYI